MSNQPPTVIPDYLSLSDEELMSWSGLEFAERLIERAQTLGADLLARRHYEITPLKGEAYHTQLTEFCKRHAWMEWWLGVTPPSKQIVLLEGNPDDMGLRLRLAQQVIDEVKHQRVFTRWVSELGGDTRLEAYSPEPFAWELYWATYNFDTALEIAASLQCTGEPILFLHLCGKLDPKESISSQLLPEDLRKDMANEVIIEEPRHVQNGRILISKYANTPAARRLALETQNRKMRAWIKTALAEYELFGARRIAPLPVI